MGAFTFNGTTSSSLGILVSGTGTWEKPSPVVDRISVPGRNGDILHYTGAYENVSIRYSCGITSDFDTVFAAFMNWLASQQGYRRLEDTYHPNHYRMATYEEVSGFNMRKFNRSGEFEVTFNCKPQSFLKSGSTKQTFTRAGTIVNPTQFTAKPLLRVYGTGTLTIGEESVQITQANSYTDLDCDLQDAYKDDSSHNCNGNILLTGDHFPVIPGGSQGVSFTSGITKVEITPRWWQL